MEFLQRSRNETVNISFWLFVVILIAGAVQIDLN